ncbi:MAG TPA: tetratricopeptide repeat protein [Thermomicrobiales bacterium]|nr:tetratricopeptide repeat protein [Thermomicrobiales bacterium]
MAPHGSASADYVGQPPAPPRPFRGDARLSQRPDLPARQTSFVGRQLELAELAELLAAPDCRLLTILGPGGIGKTRLALEAATAVRGRFADGVAFAPLQAVAGAAALAPALATALGCAHTGRADARDQVARALRPARLLLILDNVEHLLEAAPWLSELLAAAPGLRLLATSREALNLQEEWRYPLAGLTVPDEGADDPAQAEAVRLFAERAQQVRPDFALAAERAGVVRLCRLVEGLPLALELAAVWVRILSCAAIADEIERTIAFLASDLRNVPARHRSMHAAFDHSWTLLAEEDRRAFRRLAVFRGGFTHEAAARVAGATLPLLSSLVDKSLVRRAAGGRFSLHALLRQYADEHLRAAPEEAARAEAAHRAYYLAFVAARFAPITGSGQREAVAAIAAEVANIRAAWHSAVAAGDGEALGRVAHPLTLFFDFRARYREGLALLEEGLRVLRAAAPSPGIDRALASMLVDTARFHHVLLQLPAMRAALAESEALYARLAIPPPPGQVTDPLVWRAILALIDGHYEEADRLGAEAIRRNTAADRPGNLSPAWWVRGAAALWREDVDTAGEYARRGAEAALAAGDRWHLAYTRNQQGHIATARGDYAEARRHYEASYAIREELDDPEGMAGALNHLAKVAARQGAWPEAEELHRRGLAIARDIGERAVMAIALNGLGLVACATGDDVAAARHLDEGLRLAAEMGHMRLLLTLLASTGDWLLRSGRPAEAAEALALADAHPASDHEIRDRTRQLLVAVAAVLPPAAYAAAVERGRGTAPTDLAARLAPLLAEPPAAAPPPAPPAAGDAVAPLTPPAARPPPDPASALPEPLTARELAVLRLIAAGRANREIADELFLAVNTVRSYSQQLYGKLGVGSRTQAVARARELGLLD